MAVKKIRSVPVIPIYEDSIAWIMGPNLKKWLRAQLLQELNEAEKSIKQDKAELEFLRKCLGEIK